MGVSDRLRKIMAVSVQVDWDDLGLAECIDGVGWVASALWWLCMDRVPFARSGCGSFFVHRNLYHHDYCTNALDEHTCASNSRF